MNDYRNPNQQDMTGRMLLAFALTFIVILITQQFVARYYKQPEPPAAKSQPAQRPAEQSSQPTPPTAVTGRAQVAPRTPPPAAGARKQATSEAETVVENQYYRITFTNKGAVAKSWILKKYTDNKGGPLELVNSIAASQHGYPLSFFAYDENVRKKLNDAMYVQTGEGASTSGPIQAPATLSFEFSDGDMAVQKRFVFSPDSYEVRAETEVMQKGSVVTAYPSWPAGLGDQTSSSSYAADRIDFEHDDKIERMPAKKVSNGATINGPFYWAATMDQYFTAVFLPDDPNSAALVTLHNAIDIPKNPDKPDPNQRDHVSVLGAAVGDPRGRIQERIFVGPKALDVLRSVHPVERAGSGPSPNRNLEGIVDFGFFGFVAKPLFLWLRWTYEHWVPNWGWAILILTLIINVALLPLRISTMKSGMKMQKLQPQIQAINNKYRQFKLTDPRQADKNREIQALYKREGVNPVGGCLPSLLQLPFLYAFYTMLTVAIELRHAQFLWLHDLSAPDPYHLINILFIVSMFVMQKITPQGGMDPAQQKMMMFMMPVMLGVITWNLSAGLGLYWAAGNMIGIIQQLAFNRTSFGREIRAMALKRAEKKAR